MAIYHFELRNAPHVSLRERETARTTSGVVRLAMSRWSFDEHVIWPEPGVLHAIVEGDDPEELVRAFDAFSAPTTWLGISFVALPEPDDRIASLIGPARSEAIVRAALEPEETRCDFCGAPNPPPHEIDCQYAKLDYGIHGGPGGLLSPRGAGGGQVVIDEPASIGDESRTGLVSASE